MTPAEQEIVDRNEEIAQAALLGNVEGLSALFSDSIIICLVNGMVLGKEDFLNTVASGAIRFERYEHQAVEAYVYEDTRVVIGELHLKGLFAGEPLPEVVRFARTFIHEEGAWRLWLSQYTVITG